MIRLLFIALVVAFGCCMFLAGARAPARIRRPLTTAADRGAVALDGAYRALLHRVGGVEPDHESLVPVPYGSLMLTAETPNKRYGIQVALYPDPDSARQGERQLQEAGYQTSVLAIGSGASPESYLVAVGPLTSFSSCQQAMRALYAVVPPGAALVPIAWPGAAPKKATPPAHAAGHASLSSTPGGQGTAP